VDVPALLGLVFAAAGGRAAVHETVPGRLWYLGTARWAGASRQAYFARHVHGPARAAVGAALAPYPRAVLFHPTEHALRAWAGVTANPVVALESAVAADGDGLAFDHSAVAGRLVEAGLIDAPKSKPKHRRRGPRAAKNEKLQAALVRYLRDARTQAYDTLALGGTPVLPERPTQEEFGRQIGLSKSDMTRCLNDPKAPVLKHLWGMAADPSAILSFKGLPGAGSDAT
jgi:hypothetical protein